MKNIIGTISEFNVIYIHKLRIHKSTKWKIKQKINSYSLVLISVRESLPIPTLQIVKAIKVSKLNFFSCWVQSCNLKSDQLFMISADWRQKQGYNSTCWKMVFRNQPSFLEANHEKIIATVLRYVGGIKLFLILRI